MKRVRLTMKHYNELVTSRDWCHVNGYEGMKQWYVEELAFQAKRRALPIGIQPETDVGEDEERRSRRER